MRKTLEAEMEKSGNDVKSDEEWRKTLTPEEFRVTREHGTERAFSHPYYQEKREGMYRCVCCGAPLFNSETKYDSATGWPSFYAPADAGAVSEHEDHSLFMRRTEVRCANCEAHLGHVFPDGPNPTGLRYCINGVALKHDADASSNKSSKSSLMDAKSPRGESPAVSRYSRRIEEYGSEPRASSVSVYRAAESESGRCWAVKRSSLELQRQR